VYGKFGSLTQGAFSLAPGSDLRPLPHPLPWPRALASAHGSVYAAIAAEPARVLLVLPAFS
jgi:hypothetical protein